ncbi:MAG: hypothetical protein IMY71_00840 [Bacteroidetes bacterium]|nr:hypothetical protein [Bacteroidota bacterium]
MYITKMIHNLDEKGNVPKQMHKEAKELASFMALVADETTKQKPSVDIQTDIRCFEKQCDGMIQSEITEDDEIHWICPKCQNEGVISEWQGTRWDNGINN